MVFVGSCACCRGFAFWASCFSLLSLRPRAAWASPKINGHVHTAALLSYSLADYQKAPCCSLCFNKSFNCASGPSVMPGDLVIFDDILMRAANELAREMKALTKAEVPFVS